MLEKRLRLFSFPAGTAALEAFMVGLETFKTIACSLLIIFVPCSIAAALEAFKPIACSLLVLGKRVRLFSFPAGSVALEAFKAFACSLLVLSIPFEMMFVSYSIATVFGSIITPRSCTT